MHRTVEKTPDHRRRVATILFLLSSEQAQARLATDVSRERIAYELARGWFDHVYVPSSSYLVGLKGDFSLDAAETFRDAFDPVELRAMERFHRFFELRVEMFGGPEHQGGRIPVDERWSGVMKDAGYLLEDLGERVDGLSLKLDVPIVDIIRDEE